MADSAFDKALKVLDHAVGQLEAAARRKLDIEARRGDLETELAIMQDDRARLATDLDGALTRLGRVEHAAQDAVSRLDHAMGRLQSLLGAEGR